MMDFIFGGRTGVTSPDELARRRELVRALKARSAGHVPQNMWEGLNSFAEAIGGRIEEGRLDAAEAAGREGADEKFRNFLKSSLGGQAGDPAWLDAVSDPWMPEKQREVLNLYPQRQPATSDAKTEKTTDLPLQGAKQPIDGTQTVSINEPRIKAGSVSVRPKSISVDSQGNIVNIS